MPDNSLDWSTEWFHSLVWISGVSVATAVGCAVLVALLSRFTVWGRKFRRLAFAYFSPRGDAGWRPLFSVLILLLLTIASVRFTELLTYATSGLNTALQQLDPAAFARHIGILVVLATILVLVELLVFYMQQALVIRWRAWLNDHIVGDWLGDQAYHRVRFTPSAVDNPDQRIQEDVAAFPADSVELAVDAVSSLVSLLTFTITLWTLSGPLPVFGIEIPRAMSFVAYVFVIVVTVFAFRIGRPLIRLNVLRERFNASFRHALVRLRDNSENVAFHRGEEVERSTLSSRFGAIIDNTWAMVFRELKLKSVNLVVTRAIDVIPYIIQGPRYFAGQITFGDLVQTGMSFNIVASSLSFFRNAYDAFASYRAVLDRLTGLLDADGEARALPSAQLEDGDGLEVQDLTVRLPDGRTLIDDLNLSVTAGSALLLTGVSGSGKTTLLRSIAGLWPYATGVVRRPLDDGALFLSQRPYVPLGSLRTALAYPGLADRVDDEQAIRVLRQVQLPHLADRLDDEADWAHLLSPGEQQRLGFARVLVARPRVVFLDEATSAVDEGLEHTLYTLLRDELPDCTIVSIGHRSTLDQLHSERMELLGDGRWRAAALRP